MFTKIILIQVDSILVYPPTVSLIHELDKTGCKVTVLTTVVNDQLRKVLPESVSLQKIVSDYVYKSFWVKKSLITIYDTEKHMGIYRSAL